MNFICIIPKCNARLIVYAALLKIRRKIPKSDINLLNYLEEDNLFYAKTNKIKRVMIDDIIDNLNISLGGLTVDNNTKFYDKHKKYIMIIIGPN